MRRSLLILLTLLFGSLPAHAIITAGGTGRLLAPPTKEYADSGVQYIGKWGNFVGTAIGKHHFVTASHVGGGVGQAFLMDGKGYLAEACTVIPGTDLAIWRVAEELPRYAPLYTGDDEAGKEVVIYGRGARRGRPYRYGDLTLGWYWGENDNSLSWGRNMVEATTSMPGNSAVLVWSFDLGGGDQEATVAGGDSGGGVFIKDDSTWKLAGVNYASGGQYSRSSSGNPTFMAALFDARGLYQNEGKTWVQLNPNAWEPAPTLAFASRISPHLTEIRRIISGRDEANERHPLSRRLAIWIGIAAVLVGGATGIYRWRRKRHSSRR